MAIMIDLLMSEEGNFDWIFIFGDVWWSLNFFGVLIFLEKVLGEDFKIQVVDQPDKN